MSQLKKIKFSSIDDFKNAASNGELNNETIWITPDEEKEEIIVATIDEGTGVSVNIDGTQRIIYVPMMTDSIIQTLGSSDKPKFVYYNGQICNVIGSSLDALVMLYYSDATSAVLKLLYNEGYSDPVKTTVLGGSSSGSQSENVGLNIHNIQMSIWTNKTSFQNDAAPITVLSFTIYTSGKYDFILSLSELYNIGMSTLTPYDASSYRHEYHNNYGEEGSLLFDANDKSVFLSFVANGNPESIQLFFDGKQQNFSYHIEIIDEILRIK